MNGLNVTTQEWVTLLEELTQHQHLSCLTLLGWQAVLSSRELTRRERAWCPLCYGDWAAQGQALYDPLLWTLRVVTHCPQHGCLLQTRCPHPKCSRTSLTLSSRGQPGFCGYCWQSLAASSSSDKHDSTQDSLWIAVQVGAMLAIQHDLPKAPNSENFRQALKQACCTGGGITAFAHRLRTDKSVLHNWLRKPRTWQLASVLRITAATGICPLELFTGEIQARTKPLDNMPSALLPQTWRQPARPFDRAHVQAALQAVLDAQECPPPSMAEVARRLDYAPSFLRTRCPELCSAISLRFAQARAAQRVARLERICGEVKQAAIVLHEQGIAPTNQAVTALLGRGVFQEQPVFQFFVELRRELGYY